MTVFSVCWVSKEQKKFSWAKKQVKKLECKQWRVTTHRQFQKDNEWFNRNKVTVLFIYSNSTQMMLMLVPRHLLIKSQEGGYKLSVAETVATCTDPKQKWIKYCKQPNWEWRRWFLSASNSRSHTLLYFVEPTNQANQYFIIDKLL